jgi:capsule polysaccharide export protein KpsE/RkpR
LIRFEDRDPKKAAQIANAFVEELKNVNKGLAVSEASQRRLFFEEQLQDAKASLTKAEEDMKAFQEKTGVLHAEEQAKTVIESIAQLRAQIAAKEVELRVLKTYTTQNNPDLYRAEEGLKAMRAELAKLETKGGNGHNPLMSTARMASVGAEYLRKLRELKFNETLYELLLKQYELAKLDESRDATVIQVVDKAEPPEKRYKPKRRLMVTVATVSALFLSIFIVFFMEFIDKSSTQPENQARIDTLKKYLNFKFNFNLKKFISRRKNL